MVSGGEENLLLNGLAKSFATGVMNGNKQKGSGLEIKHFRKKTVEAFNRYIQKTELYAAKGRCKEISQKSEVALDKGNYLKYVIESL
jgi:hypothetical protein